MPPCLSALMRESDPNLALQNQGFTLEQVLIRIDAGVGSEPTQKHRFSRHDQVLIRIDAGVGSEQGLSGFTARVYTGAYPH